MAPPQSSHPNRQRRLTRSLGLIMLFSLTITLFSVEFAMTSFFGAGKNEFPPRRVEAINGMTVAKPKQLSKAKNPINVLFGVCGNNSGFWSEVEVALKSVLLNAPVDNDLTLHYMVDEEALQPLLDLLDRIKIRSWQTRNQVTIKIYNVQSHVEAWTERIQEMWQPYYGKKRNFFRHSVGSYFRLFAQEVLSKDAEHAIYMDSDVVIMANLQELWKYADSTKIFQWGQRGLCAGFSVINVQKLYMLWEKIPVINLKKIGKRMKSGPGDQLVLRAVNRSYPELVGTLPSEWDASANNGYNGKYDAKYNSATEEEILRQLPRVGMLHFNGGGTSEKEYFKKHNLVMEHKHDHSFGLVQYYVNIPWTWARFMVESERSERHVAYSPLVVDAGNSPVSSVNVTATS